MFINRRKVLGSIAALTVAAPVMALAANTPDTFGPINVQSGKVTKLAHETGGKTAHRSQWINAPKDRYFEEDSWKVKLISAQGKNASVSIADIKRKPVTITLPNGDKVQHKFAVAFLIVAHAETGSGLGYKAAWAEAEVSALSREFE